jgi:hypothetical protein
MTDEEIIRLMKLMSRYLKHRDGCSDAPDFAADSRRPENCNCGLQKVRRILRRYIPPTT